MLLEIQYFNRHLNLLGNIFILCAGLTRKELIFILCHHLKILKRVNKILIDITHSHKIFRTDYINVLKLKLLNFLTYAKNLSRDQI
jgi:hypothetical protein